MDETNYPIPPSHKTFQLGSVIIDSNFDSGNLYNAEKINNTNYNLWIAVDHPKNQYRTWFHFSLLGLNKGTVVTFNIRNMQNQSRLLNEGLVPVFREEDSTVWRRVAHKIDLYKIEYNEGWIQWTFRHTMTSNQKVYIAFFYPWSNIENSLFLDGIEHKCKEQDNIYFKRSTIIKSLEGRPIQFLCISSKKGMINKVEKYEDQHLFPNGGEPKEFISDKKCIIIGARVHPGEVPGSHVMTGIIQELTQDNDKAKILRDKFVFYIFPIFNPDGVARGHYRVDPNGINLNRCYINPSPKNHSPIYAVKKIIMHYHKNNKFFGFLDLHAHASRKGVFIYGNSINELQKQVEICLFPKILSMNSQIFEYEGSNFTQKNMYCKDIGDHISKEGAGRVALFKATKNPYSWTLECNYNRSRVLNVLEQRKTTEETALKPTDKNINNDIIINYKYPNVKETNDFYTIEQFRQLGKEICESFLDLIEMNPESRIDNPKSHFQSVQNLKLNLAVALLRMAPTRFQSQFKKIYHYLQGPASSKELSERGVKALYYLLIRKAKIENINSFLKDNDDSSLVLPTHKPKRLSMSPIRQTNSPIKSSREVVESPTYKHSRSLKPLGKEMVRIKLKQIATEQKNEAQSSQEPSGLLRLNKVENNYNLSSDQSEEQAEKMNQKIYQSMINQTQTQEMQNQRFNKLLNSQLLHLNFNRKNFQRMGGKNPQANIESLRAYRNSMHSQSKKITPPPSASLPSQIKLVKGTRNQLPSLIPHKVKAMVSISSLGSDIKFLPKGSFLASDKMFMSNNL